jgi:hypothetical protein
MSNLIVPDVGKIAMAKIIVQLHHVAFIDLFQNNYMPDHATSLPLLTVATFAGYAQQAMTTPVVSPVLDGTNRAFITWDDVTFTRTGAPNNTIYGYYVSDEAGNLLWVERFDSPVPVNVDGVFITLTPKLTDMSQFLNP